VAMYYHQDNGVYGKASFQNSSWRFGPLEEERELAAAKKLFDGIKKQIKTGEYLVPNGLSL